MSNRKAGESVQAYYTRALAEISAVAHTSHSYRAPSCVVSYATATEARIERAHATASATKVL